MKRKTHQDYERERLRRELMHELYGMVDELGGRAAHRQISSLPFDTLEQLFSWMLTSLERAMNRIVTIAFNKLYERRKR